MSKMMSVWIREGWVERYTWLGVGYLIVVSALQWSRGGPSVREPGTGSIPGAVSDLLAFYGAWYGVGLTYPSRSPPSPKVSFRKWARRV